MTVAEFNEKYKDYLIEGYYGLDIDDELTILLLDTLFSVFTTRPNFKYMQIKLKYGTGRFYAEGIDNIEEQMVEEILTLLYQAKCNKEYAKEEELGQSKECNS